MHTLVYLILILILSLESNINCNKPDVSTGKDSSLSFFSFPTGYITVTLLRLLVFYRLSTNEEGGPLNNKGRRLPVHVGWEAGWSP